MVKIEAFEIFNTCDKGRGLKATEHIVAGTEILREDPLVYSLINSKTRGTYCDSCFAAPERLFKCSKCNYTAYCNTICQRRDWDIHKHECKCIRKVSPRQPPDICRLVSHLLFKYYSGRNEGNITDIEYLTENRDYISSTRKEAFFTFSALLHDYLKGCAFDGNSVDIYGLLCRISCNSFTITNSEMNSLGTGIYKTASLLNHSCSPNCIALFDGPQIIIRSLKDINVNDELLISYVNLSDPAVTRRRELKEGYMFDCACTLCSESSFSDFLMKCMKCQDCSPLPCIQPMLNISCQEEWQEVFRNQYPGICLQKCPYNEKTCKLAMLCGDELDALYNDIKIIPSSGQQNKLKSLLIKGEKTLGPTNISLLHCYEVAMDGCLETGDWNGALQYGRKLDKPYLMILPENHPTIGLHYFKQGKLALLLDELKEGVDYLKKSLKILQVTHGEKHELVVALESTIMKTSYEMRYMDGYNSIERMLVD